jgi:AmmeMemoRadiSam system protein A
MSIIAGFVLPHPPIIVPEVGRGQEKGAKATIAAYEAAGKMIADLKPEVLIVSSPHAECYYDYFHISPGDYAAGDFEQFGAKEVKFRVNYDVELRELICKRATEKHIPAGTLGEKSHSLDHGTMVPLYFIRKYLPECPIVRIGLSGLPNYVNYELGIIIKETCDTLGRKAVYIASGDLSHKLKIDGPYGYDKKGPVFDKEVIEDLGNGDFLSLFGFDEGMLEEAAECGLGSFQIMAGAFDGEKITAKLMSYEGPFGVGYGVCSFFPVGKDEHRKYLSQIISAKKKKIEDIRKSEDSYVKLARETIENYVRSGKRITLPAGAEKELLETKAGVFVSLKMNGRLRGCIGTIMPVHKRVGEEIISNAISACSQDTRFDPVSKDELDSIVYDVDVLSSTEPIKSEKELDPKIYGVVVESGYKRGVLLPDLDGVDSALQQIQIAEQKAGIKDGEVIKLYRFKVKRHL